MLGGLLAVAACTVDIHPGCNASGNLDVDVDANDAPTKPRADDEAPAADPEPPAPPVDRSCPGPRHNGATECFPGRCSAGQYCNDPTSDCLPGCVSDANCGPRDTCVRTGGDPIGRCEPCVEQASHEPAEHCVDPRRRGATACFPGSCEPGQYCVSRGLNHCEPGCVSDDNCGPTETCTRPEGYAVGICRSCYF